LRGGCLDADAVVEFVGDVAADLDAPYLAVCGVLKKDSRVGIVVHWVAQQHAIGDDAVVYRVEVDEVGAGGIPSRDELGDDTTRRIGHLKPTRHGGSIIVLHEASDDLEVFVFVEMDSAADDAILEVNPFPDLDM